MIFAQFFNRNVMDETKIIEGCGDRAVVIIDARLKPESIGQIAAQECEKRGYVAWQIFKGETFTRSAPVSQIWYVTKGTKDRTALSATYGN